MIQRAHDNSTISVSCHNDDDKLSCRAELSGGDALGEPIRGSSSVTLSALRYLRVACSPRTPGSRRAKLRLLRLSNMIVGLATCTKPLRWRNFCTCLPVIKCYASLWSLFFASPSPESTCALVFPFGRQIGRQANGSHRFGDASSPGGG